MFPNLNQTKKKPVPNVGTELGPGTFSFRMRGTGKIRFLGNGIRERRPLGGLGWRGGCFVV